MSTEKRETRLSIRIDPALKEAAQNVANDKGMDLSTAVNMFLAKMVKDHALPFTPTSLPAETLQAFKEAKTPDKLEKYSTSDAMWTVLDV
ncbi:type II toxin-antitoxin system RelB/DinJ family antitoxin [Lacticaseibacillus zeae]|uniref:Type II toxin-antitoxin system RelB/DinJ family antitoxin n=1 Tax=Lacticaseibacillus zeae subsp. silagei TaxID=3068307 RepID=A0ABD7Z8T8_LACZE|nr:MULTISPECIES: type II toxin-antitoxin system RelB/DinJ family antitoxin [Lacticaseibacillus]MDE3316582.1 type II toxin-antitoxin system RelB/DinJ family antitoxin [Lacticaseibacillus zeae]OFR97020.1 damage-inducible protein [Lactobacillus sp. HMSC068F07]WLV83378.1 type II toxin-antitoxin system RelB/DinJ family antitoxin [Lacticaseibacillus sp. NCIMB 15475]WLV86127.1 type II toxin-antitoxin system RelB/DinJ family antitoxin [Lacticaseibacillus sp. NCIMB 15474]